MAGCCDAPKHPLPTEPAATKPSQESCCGAPPSGLKPMSLPMSLPGSLQASCACTKPPSNGTAPNPSAQKTNNISTARYCGSAALAFALWLALYMNIEKAAQWLTYTAFSLIKGSPLAAAVEFFIYDTAKILLLLIFMVYGIAWFRATLHVERVRDYLAGKGRAVGYVAGAGFGAITPFCSCSSIPLFLGFTTARIPIGITMSFLITSPLINEVAVVLLWGLLGWKFTLIYVAVGMLAGITGGMVMDALRAERWLQPYLLDALRNPPLPTLNASRHVPRMSLMQRHAFAWHETGSITRKVWLWVMVGVALGAALHGFVPQAWFEAHLSQGQWWSVPLAVAVGIPLYTNVTGIIPIMESLLLKGLPVGTTLAFCMSTVAASLPEVLMLKQVMRWRLLAVFLGLLLVIFTLAGWFFNATQGYIF